MAGRLSWSRIVVGLVVAVGSAIVMPAAQAMAAPKAATVSAGYVHTCDVTTKGAVRCWGYNAYGQLGDNSTTNSPKPVAVYGLGSKVKNVTAGYLHTCALTTKGKVWCWGFNGYGQLGDNTTTNSAKPVAVAGLGKVKAIDAGYLHTCAITTKGAVKCWGYNANGQLGDNSTTNSLTPVTVYGITKGAKAVSASYTGSCAITSKGAAKCWGDNSQGQLGDNSTTNSNKPVTVYGLTKKVKQISAGQYYTCAVNGNNKALCWGYNGQGQLGDNSATNSNKPVNVYNLDKSTKVSVGYMHTCVVTAKKVVKCWGYNAYGAVGDNTSTSVLHPVKVFGY